MERQALRSPEVEGSALASSLPPAIRPWDDAVNKKGSAAANGNHVLEVIVKSKDSRVIARWWEASELGLKEANPGVVEARMLGHTEQKALVRMNLKPGQKIEMYGSISPCAEDYGCHWALDLIAKEKGVSILYRTPRTTTNYVGGVGHVQSITW